MKFRTYCLEQIRIHGNKVGIGLTTWVLTSSIWLMYSNDASPCINTHVAGITIGGLAGFSWTAGGKFTWLRRGTSENGSLGTWKALTIYEIKCFCIFREFGGFSVSNVHFRLLEDNCMRCPIIISHTMWWVMVSTTIQTVSRWFKALSDRTGRCSLPDHGVSGVGTNTNLVSRYQQLEFCPLFYHH